MKRAWRSKINWLGLAISLLGLFMDPEFQRMIGTLVSPEVAARAISLAGMAVMILRTCCTSQAIGKGDQ